ncbi:MAG: PEGA domain-containing protein [Kiritimatiellae bacterium]|nr:PEGA domain-containing protein [Kiritimatiellia bacterium]
MKFLKRYLIFGLVGLVGFMLAGCASIILGTTQKVPVNSNPTGAKVTVYDSKNMAIGGGTTPCSLSLSRGSGFFSSAKYRIVIEKPGYEKREVKISGSVNGWYIAGNLVFGGLIGWLILDPATGAMWSLSPDDVKASLSTASSSQLRSGNELTVMLLEQVPMDYRNKMILIGANDGSI